MSRDEFRTEETGDGVITTLSADGENVAVTIRRANDKLNRSVTLTGIDAARELRRQLDEVLTKHDRHQAIVGAPHGFVAACGRV